MENEYGIFCQPPNVTDKGKNSYHLSLQLSNIALWDGLRCPAEELFKVFGRQADFQAPRPEILI